MRQTLIEHHDGHIGTAIRMMRERHGLSQEEFGALVGVHGRTISRHERGASEEIATELLEKIAEVCATTTDELWRLADNYAAKKRPPGRPLKPANRPKKYVQKKQQGVFTG
jgi:transcriptional regulator with XRE-family HTH domain